MPPPELTDAEVLSLLERMEAEENVFAQLRQARQQTAAVIRRYQAIVAELPRLIAQHTEVKAAVAALAATREGTILEIQKTAELERARLDATRQPLLAEIRRLEVDKAAAVEAMQRAAAAAETQRQLITEQIAALQTEYDTVAADFAKFKKTHGL